jgi:hypothetical protein
VNVKAIFWSTIVAISVDSGSCPISRAAPRGKAMEQRIVCNTGYSPEECQVQIVVLRQTLAKYRADGLGEWTWVLVRSKDWKRILVDRGLDPNRPAFSYLAKRETFIEGALVSDVSSRGVELSGLWHMTVEELLDLAVRHEMGHAVCNERDEVEANRAAELLLHRKAVSCDRSVSTRKQLGLIGMKH